MYLFNDFLMETKRRIRMLLVTLLFCFSPAVLGQLEESQLEEEDVDADLADFDLDLVRFAPQLCARDVFQCVFTLTLFVSAGTAQGPSAGEADSCQGRFKKI